MEKKQDLKKFETITYGEKLRAAYRLREILRNVRVDILDLVECQRREKLLFDFRHKIVEVFILKHFEEVTSCPDHLIAPIEFGQHWFQVFLIRHGYPNQLDDSQENLLVYL